MFVSILRLRMLAMAAYDHDQHKSVASGVHGGLDRVVFICLIVACCCKRECCRCSASWLHSKTGLRPMIYCASGLALGRAGIPDQKLPWPINSPFSVTAAASSVAKGSMLHPGSSWEWGPKVTWLPILQQ